MRPDMLATMKIAVLCLCWAAAAGVRPAPLSVPRCCPAGHALAADRLQAVLPRAAAAAACRPHAEPQSWAPSIYAPARGTYLERGRLPPHWRLTDAALPSCQELRVLPNHSAQYYSLLANNGTLLLPGPVPIALPIDRYCGDAAAALICLEDAPIPSVSKCCPDGQALHGTSCVTDVVTAGSALRELEVLANSSGLSVGRGWPRCAAGQQWTEAGLLKEVKLRENGALEFSDGLLAPGAWCAEGSSEVADVRLMACEEDARSVRPRPPLSVPRCCPAGYALSAEELRAVLSRAAAVAACRPQSAPQPWAPRIYAPARGSRGTYLERGHLPTHWRLTYEALPSCEEFRVLPDHSAPYALLADSGTLLLPGPTLVTLPIDRYCGDSSAALVCVEDGQTASVSKCCTDGYAFDGTGCVADEVAARSALQELVTLANSSGLGVGRGWPPCPAGPRWAEAGALRGTNLRKNGALELGDGVLAPGAWCAEGAAGATGARVLACEADARAARPKQPLRHTLYGAGLAVGAAFLAATLAAGFAMPAAHHALHWRCQTYYVAALMLGDALLAGTQLAGDAVPPTLCRVLAVCMHFLFLSAFFWLNTMCFNIWWTFRDFRPTSLERGQEAWRLRVYMVYAWGGPLALAGAAAALDAAAAPGLLRPRFGEERCWFGGDVEVLVYFFGPVGVLLLVNLALFISTTRQLTCGLWRRDEVKSTSERAALGRVCAKLVVVMGVTWGADVVSWAAGGPHYVWYATDLLNALQGLLIFLVVGCQPHAWAALRGACAACRRRRMPRRAASSTHLPSVGESLTNTTPAPPASSQGPAPPQPAANKIPMETVC